MKNLTLLLLLSLHLAIQAQEKAPRIQSVTTDFERIEIIRMKPGTDMLEGLNMVLKEKKINNAVILS